MKKVYKICFYLIPLICFEAHSLSDQDKLLKQRYTDDVNYVEFESSGPLFSPVSKRDRAFNQIVKENSFSSVSENFSYSPVPKKLSVEEDLTLRPKSEEEKKFATFLENHDFAQNPTLTIEGYSSVLGNNEHLENNFTSPPEDPCTLEKSGVLNSENIEDLSGPIESIEKQHQYCGFKEEQMLGSIDASIIFCNCVRSKTQENEDGKGLYKKIQNPKQFDKLRNLYRQKLVEKVMPGLLKDIEDMTKAANDFLSTDELSHLLYEVKTSEDIKDEDARSLLEKTRLTMHSCSGLGLANMMEDLFGPQGRTGADCDENSAEILLNGFMNSIECKGSKDCVDYKQLAKSELYKGKKAYSTLSDFLTYKYSQNMVGHRNIDEEERAIASKNDDLYSKSLMKAKAMTDYDIDGVPFVNLDMINPERRLPPKEQLKLLYSLMDTKNSDIKSSQKLTEDEKKLVNGLIEVLSKNSIYNNSKHFLNANKKLSDDEQLTFLKNFAQTLKSDMERRLKKIPSSQKYFNESSDPVERMEKIIVNNYLYLGDEVTKGCAETKRKLKKLCASISGDGMALFSHPDYRDKADEMLLDSELQNEVAKIAGDKADGRSPRADQIYCDANYSSLSSDCIEEHNVKSQSQQSPIHCRYPRDWLLSDEYGLSSFGDPAGNVQSISNDLIEKASRGDYKSSSEDDFRTVMKVRPTEVYKSEGRKLKNIVRPQKKKELKETQNFANKQIARASIKERALETEIVEPKPVPKVKSANPEKKNEEVKERSFSDNFQRTPSSFSPRQFKDSISSPREDSQQISDDDKHSVTPPSKTEDLNVAKLMNELKQTKERQKSLEDQLKKLSDLSDTKEDQEHKAKIKEKEDQLKSLQADIGKLKRKVETEKPSSKQKKRLQSPSVFSGPNENSNSPSSFPSSVRAERPIASRSTGSPEKRVNSTRMNTVQDAETSSVNQRSRTPAARSNIGVIALSSINSRQLLPSTVDLSSVASTLKKEKYVLLDTGNPELAEKVIFKSDFNGEILFDESGEPIIESREIVKLEDELAEKKTDQAEEPESQVGEVQDSKSYRWSEVEELLDLNTNGLPIQ